MTGQQRKGEAISLVPINMFQLLLRHVDIKWADSVENLPVHLLPPYVAYSLLLTEILLLKRSFLTVFIL